MKKGYRPTRRLRSRGRMSKRRFTRRARTSLMQRASTTYQIPRQLYSPLPAQLKVAMTAQASAGWDLAVQTICPHYRILLLRPNQLTFPGGFQALHQLYARSFIDRAVVSVSLTNGSNAFAQVCLLQVPYIDTIEGGTYTAAQFDGFASSPEAILRTIGTGTGGHDSVTMSLAIDVNKIINTFDESIACTTSDRTVPPVITVPDYEANGVPSSSWPTVELIAFNPSAQAITLFRQIQITYHMTFSQRHATVVT